MKFLYENLWTKEVILDQSTNLLWSNSHKYVKNNKLRLQATPHRVDFFFKHSLER